MNSQYFEGILQLRPADNEIDAFISKIAVDFIAKKKKVRNGIDYYMSSNSFLKKLGKRLQKEIGGSLLFSESLHTRDRQSSKDLYRVTALFRLYPFRIGDVVVSKKTLYLVTGSGKEPTGKNLVTRKKSKISSDAKLLEKHKVTVSKTQPSLEVLDPETFQSTRVENSEKTSAVKVKIVKYNGKIYLV